MHDDQRFMTEAVKLARENVEGGGRPFAALLVRDGEVLSAAANEMHVAHDPTAHAELLTIRMASQRLKSTRLDGCVIYATGQPCPMCLSAMYLCGVSRVVFAAANSQAEAYGLSTAAIYQALALPLAEQALSIEHLPQVEVADLYRAWRGVNAQ